MPRSDADLRLESAFARYETAVQQGERVELVSARMSLCLLLELSGWEPPPEVRDQMWRDRRSLAELERSREESAVERGLRAASHRPLGSQGTFTPHASAR